MFSLPVTLLCQLSWTIYKRRKIPDSLDVAIKRTVTLDTRLLSYINSYLIPASSEAITEGHLLLYWIAETHSCIQTAVEYGQTYYILKDEELEELAWWVQQLHDKVDVFLDMYSHSHVI